MKTNLTIQMIKSLTTAYTHSGVFHADDVFAAALLKLINPNIVIERVPVVPADEPNALVFDIGGGEFDHHFDGSPVRSNGIPYSSFGLLWRVLGPQLYELNANQVDEFDRLFVEQIDLADNSPETNPLTMVIGAMNPNWDETTDFNTAFEQAVQFALDVLKRQFRRYTSATEAIGIVQTALDNSNGTIVVLPKFAPWQSILVPSTAMFVIHPSLRGGYQATAIPKALDSKENKIYFPAEWAGKPANELPEGMTFCHKGRFTITTETLDQAINYCDRVIANQVTEDTPIKTNHFGGNK